MTTLRLVWAYLRPSLVTVCFVCLFITNQQVPWHNYRLLLCGFVLATNGKSMRRFWHKLLRIITLRNAHASDQYLSLLRERNATFLLNGKQRHLNEGDNENREMLTYLMQWDFSMKMSRCCQTGRHENFLSIATTIRNETKSLHTWIHVFCQIEHLISFNWAVC